MVTTADVTNWDTQSPADIVAYIITRYHDRLRRDVPPLIDAARDPAAPPGLADALADFWTEMQMHMMKEERVLFPMIRQGARGSQVYVPVRVMEQEHEAHAEHLAAIRQLAGNFVAPLPALAQLYRGLAMLEAELLEHIALENNVLFPRASR